MTQAQVGDKVKVHYEGFLEDGSTFDSSFDKEPLELTIGSERVIPGFESAIVGMSEGETKSISVAPEEGFGAYRNDLLVNVEKNQLPSNIDPQLGMMLQVRSDEDNIRYFTIADITEDTVTLDGNHPLAGKEISFTIQLLEIL